MEKRGLEELKKMTLEELKAISRPLEVGEIIQEGDWFEVCTSVEFSASTIGEKFAVHHRPRYRPIETPTDKPADEIKLGWYRNTDEELFDVRLVLTGTNGTSVCGLENGMVAAVSVGYFIRHYETYLGTTLPEPGEWVDPGDVKLSELPIRARFRDCEGDEDWYEQDLNAFDPTSEHPYMAYCTWFRFCQVWRPSK